jgi:hypothetical protein
MAACADRPEALGMKLIALLSVAAIASTAGASTAHATRTGPRIAGRLPREALLVSAQHATIALGLDGRTRARIAAQPAWAAPGTRSDAYQELAIVLPSRVFVVDRAGRWYVLGGSGRFELLTAPEIRLADGLTVTPHSVRRGTHVLLDGLVRVAGSLAVGETTALDLDTGARWRLADNCYAVGLANEHLLEFCGPSGSGAVVLVSVSESGVRTILSHLPDSLYPGGASISPDGKYVVGMFSPGCGPAYSFVMPTAGGPARALTGTADWTVGDANSSVIGWTRDGRIVARIEPSRPVDVDPKPGIYVVDPSSLRRTRAYPNVDPWAFWAAR